MLVHLEDILPEGIEVDVSLDPDDPALEGIDVTEPVKGFFDVRKNGRQVLVRGRVRGKVGQTCARCLKRFVNDIYEDVDIELRPVGELGKDARERELGSDDLDVEFFRGDALDVGHIVAEQLSLSTPMKPLCREDCSGICPRCGADLGEGACGCEPDTDPRWSALKDLKDRMDSKK